jgi:hypothetical protein
MAWHFWPALAPQDSLLVPAAPPDGFLEYLHGLDLEPPRFTTEVDPAATFTPFGWNEEAVGRNAGYRRPSVHPDLAVVRRVNSRAYSFELERSLFGEDADGSFPDGHRAAGRFVAKGNHGHAGIGQMRFDAAPDSGPSGVRSLLSSRLTRLAARHGGVVIEPELQVECEWGVLFDLGHEGGLSALRHHRLLSGPAGGYAGALVFPAGVPDADWEPHEEGIRDGLRRIAAALHGAGYFGPVGVDIFTHRLDGHLRLRLLVDLNARHSMALPAHGLAARFPGSTILLRQFPVTALRRAGDSGDLRSLCDSLSFNSGSRRGMIRLTPQLGFSRISLAFFGDDETDVNGMQNEFMKRGMA